MNIELDGFINLYKKSDQTKKVLIIISHNIQLSRYPPLSEKENEDICNFCSYFFGFIQKSYEQVPWVGYKISLFWPPGYCHGRNCMLQKVFETFTIHGLCPHDAADQSPPIPPNGNKYNDSLVSLLLFLLLIYKILQSIIKTDF